MSTAGEITGEDYARMEGINKRRFYIEGLKGILTLNIEPVGKVDLTITSNELRLILSKMFIETLTKKCPEAADRIKKVIMSGQCVFRELKPGEKRVDDDTAIYTREFFK